MTGFRGRVSPVFPDVFYGLADTVVEPCVGVSVLPARDRCSIQLCLFVGADKGGARSPLRRGDSSFSVRWSECLRIGACLLYYYKCCRSQVSEPGITGICGLAGLPRPFVPARPPPDPLPSSPRGD